MAHARKLSTTVRPKATWGFIGLGQMGYPMAKNLRARIPASDRLVILDINQDVMNQFAQETENNTQVTERAQSAHEVAERAVSYQEFSFFSRNAEFLTPSQNIIITSLPSPQIVKDTFRSITEKGVLPLEEKRLFIDCSTIDPDSSRQVAKEVCESLDAHFVDAPMSGGAVGAQTGSLSFMFGAPSESRNKLPERVQSILLLMGKNAWHMGDQGCGVSSKLCNNYILAINNIATSEALNMGQKLGLDLKVLTKLVNSSTGHCWPMEVNNPVPGVIPSAPASNGYDPGCPISMINKDLGLAMAGAKDYNIPLLLADRAHDIYDMVDEDFHGRDFSVVYKWLQQTSSKL